MTNIESEIRNLRQEVATLTLCVKELSDLVKATHGKMDGHIDFVENVYTSVRHPLNFIKKRIDYLTGKTQIELPEIEAKIENETG
jgi:hypothetical protein